MFPSQSGFNESDVVVDEVLSELSLAKSPASGGIIYRILLNILTIELAIFWFTQSVHIKNGTSSKSELDFRSAQVLLGSVLEAQFSVVLGYVSPFTDTHFILPDHPVQWPMVLQKSCSILYMEN